MILSWLIVTILQHICNYLLFSVGPIEERNTYRNQRWFRLASLYPERIDYVEYFRNGEFFDVAFEIVIGGCSPYAFGVKTLIEDKAKEDGFIVEIKFVAFDVKFAQAGVAVGRVDDGVAVAKFEA